jgi:Raf kinase inhibitor-like YbhB/YbcL family protein
VKELSVRSAAFQNNQRIPMKYTCDGEEISPPLMIYRVPTEAKSLALIFEDPDVSSGIYIHWLVWNMSPQGKIPENTVPGVQGANSSGRTSFEGPCPPSGTHHYVFRAYALDAELELEEGQAGKNWSEPCRIT